MNEAQWTKPGGTFSHKNACKEFGLKEEEILDAIKNNKIQFRVNYAHGNPYYRVLRAEVVKLVKKLYGKNAIEEQKIKFELKRVNREINSFKRKIKVLEKEKSILLEKQEGQ